ncbi:hypothetical protein DIPPA_14355 [Diplonema papillatum]|nr:hypothetical protein DIPPA_14355 [Diplonema papillatum]
MDRINALIQEARGMAERANRDQLDAVFGILDVATTLLRRQIEANSGEPAQQRQQQQQHQQQQQQPQQQAQQQRQPQKQHQQQPQQQQRPQQQQQQQQQQPQPQQQRRQRQRQQQPQQQQQQQQQPQQQQQQQQQQPQPPQGEQPTPQRQQQRQEGTWVEVARRRPVFDVSPEDWNVPVLGSGDIEGKEEGVVVAPNADAAVDAVGAAADAADQLAGSEKAARFAVLCRDAFEGSTLRHVLMKDGQVRAMHAWTKGEARQLGRVTARAEKAVADGGEPRVAATTVLAFVVARKHAPPGVWECVERDPLAAMTRLCRRAVTTAYPKARLEAGAMWGLTSQRGRRELLVRLSCAHAEGVVEGSGRDGGFWRPIEKAARDAMPVVALSEDVSREAAMAILGKAGRAGCGLVLGTKRLLLRVRGAGGLEQVRAAAGKHAAAPLVLAPRFMVTGAKPREHEADVVADLRRAGWAVEPVSAFVRGGSRTCVVATIEPPPFRVLERGNAPPLVVNDYDRSELPREARKKLAGAGGPVKTRRVKLPAAEAGAGPATSPPATQGTKRKGREPEEPAKAATVEPGILQRVVEGVVNALSPPRQRLRVSGEDEEMTGGPAIDATAGGQEQGGHRHSFDTSRVSKPKNGFTCAICKEEKLPKQVRRACKGCDIFACQLCSKC